LILRGEFLRLTLGALSTGAVASPTPSPGPSASPDPWDMCDDTGSLPWDRPLGLKMRALDGPDFDLVAYRGKAVMINVFATWCGPCNDEMPHVVEAARDFQSRGFEVVGVDDREPDNTVRAFRKQFGISFPIAMDPNGRVVQSLEVGRAYTAGALPYTFFIAPNGYLYCMRRGRMGRDELRYRVTHFLDAIDAANATSKQ